MSIPEFPSPLIEPAADLERRFGGVGRLYGEAALEIFRHAHVCIVGVGGVGSWTVEALARSGLGEMTLIDLDHVAESNINRQIHALTSTLGAAKVVVLAQRVAQINPECRVHTVEDFVDADNLALMIPPGKFSIVVDAIDSVRAKTPLIAYCHQNAIALITIGAAGGQLDPTRVRVADLAHTEHEPLLAKVRKRLRKEYGFPTNIKTRFGVSAVFSDEPLIYPMADDAQNLPGGSASATRAQARASVSGLNCAGFGSSVMVTAVFGLVAAAEALRLLAASPSPREP